MNLGPHAFFIVASYAVTAAIMGGLILRAVLDQRAQLRALDELERRGVRRRSTEDDPLLSNRDHADGEAATSRSG